MYSDLFKEFLAGTLTADDKIVIIGLSITGPTELTNLLPVVGMPMHAVMRSSRRLLRMKHLTVDKSVFSLSPDLAALKKIDNPKAAKTEKTAKASVRKKLKKYISGEVARG